MSRSEHSKRFIIDIDNVIASTDEVMREVIRHYTHGRVSLAYEDVTSFRYEECLDPSGNGITKDEWHAVHELFSEPRYLWQVKPRQGAGEGLNRLAEIGILHVATSRLPKARRVTIEWLDHYKIPVHALHFVSAGEKHVAFRSFTCAVEDDYDQATSFVANGTPCVLMRHPWNAAKACIAGLEWVGDWGELVERLLRW